MSTTTTTTDPADPEADTLAGRHVAMARADLAAGRASTAVSRTLRLAAEDLRAALELLPPLEPATQPRLHPLLCPCALGGLWAGVPRARRRHAVLCALWTPPTASEPR